MKDDTTSRLPVIFEDLKALKGMYCRNMRDNIVYKILDVGRDGVTVQRSEGFLGNTFGDFILLTWRLFKKRYTVMVHVSEIDAKGELH